MNVTRLISVASSDNPIARDGMLRLATKYRAQPLAKRDRFFPTDAGGIRGVGLPVESKSGELLGRDFGLRKEKVARDLDVVNGPFVVVAVGQHCELAEGLGVCRRVASHAEMPRWHTNEFHADGIDHLAGRAILRDRGAPEQE